MSDPSNQSPPPDGGGAGPGGGGPGGGDRNRRRRRRRKRPGGPQDPGRAEAGAAGELADDGPDEGGDDGPDEAGAEVASAGGAPVAARAPAVPRADTALQQRNPAPQQKNVAAQRNDVAAQRGGDAASHKPPQKGGPRPERGPREARGERPARAGVDANRREGRDRKDARGERGGPRPDARGPRLEGPGAPDARGPRPEGPGGADARGRRDGRGAPAPRAADPRDDRRGDRRPTPAGPARDDAARPRPAGPAPSRGTDDRQSPGAARLAATAPRLLLDESPSAGGWGIDDSRETEVRLVPDPIDARDADGEDVFLPENAETDDRPRRGAVLANVAGVKFLDAGTVHEYEAGEQSYARGDRVVVDSDRGPVLATIAVSSRRAMVEGTRRRVLRRATAEDLKQTERNVAREQEAFRLCKDRIRARKLPMKLVRAEYALGGGRITIYFASEDRIDFRDLARDLSTQLQGRIEMRQVGARDEAKMVGGIGSCGRELCCSTFLPSFAPVSIKMAKDQNLVLNPTKVAGQCGRLKCCLVFEQSTYLELKKGMPKLGKRVRTPGGMAKVVELDVLRRRVKVWLEAGGYETFVAEEVQSLAPPGQGPASSDADGGGDDGDSLPPG